MGGSNVDDPEKDPTLFPESRVRPWVVDKEAERKMEDMYDSLEKTLSFVSPVKDGLGVSALDRTLGCDNSGELFFQELASLEAKKRAKAAGDSGRACGIKNIREIFEDLYRETHGLPPRKRKDAPVGIHGGTNGNARPEEHRTSEAEVTVDSSQGGRERGRERGAGGEQDDGDGDGLAADPEVARLLAELQAELDDDCSDGSGTEAGGEMDEDGAEDDDDDESEGGEGQGEQEGDGGVRRLVEADGHGKKAGKEHLTAKEKQQQQQQQQSVVECTARTATVGDGQALLCRGEQQNLLLRPEEGGRIDISRIKIDGPRPQARPRSAPSACLSAGGFSRVSSRTCSSSRLARTVSQKLLQATKEAELQRAALSDGQGAVPPRPCSPASAIACADGRINVVKRNAEALQASMSVKRRSYLNARQPRAARWSPRDPDLCPGRKQQRSSPRRALRSVQPPSATVRQRPKTAVPMNRQRRLAGKSGFTGSGGSTNPNGPLLNRREAEFVFGDTAAATPAGEDDVSNRPPSLRTTTLGRMLRRSSASSFAGSSSSNTGDDSRNHTRSALLSGCSSTSSLFRRPLSAGDSSGRRIGHPFRDNSNSTRRKKEKELEVKFKGIPSSSSKPRSGTQGGAGVKATGMATAVAQRAKTRPRSAAPDSCRQRGERPSSPFEHEDRDRNDRSTVIGDREGSGGRMFAAKAAARRRGGRTTTTNGCGGGAELPEEAGERVRSPSAMNARQALEATIKEAIGVVPPLEQFVSARETIAEMKRINTKDSTGETLLTTQGMSKARVAEECWTSEAEREYR